ncbi:MAG TPA: GAF domain-containing protein, partial [Ktedonobacteraceae bacterium]|nr:GAF domain-containing protein [Ktedonobacteraceae bacterium]
MSTEVPRKRAAQSAPLSDPTRLLMHLDALTDWWMRADLVEQGDRFLQDLQPVFAAQVCALYLAEPSATRLTLAASTAQAPSAVPEQLSFRAEAFWSVVSEHWRNRRVAEVNDICRQVWLLDLGTQARTMVFAPLFAPRTATPLGLLLIEKRGAWTPEEYVCLRQISISLAVRLAEQRAHDQLEREREQVQLVNAFVRHLCAAPRDPAQEETVRRQARLLGVDLARPHLIALAQLAAPQGGQGGLSQILGQLKEAVLQHFPGALLTLQESAEMICLLPLHGSDKQAVASLKQIVHHLAPRVHLLLGVGNPTRTLHDYARAAAEARDALAYAQHFHEGGVFHIQEVGPLRFLKLDQARESRPTDRYS